MRNKNFLIVASFFIALLLQENPSSAGKEEEEALRKVEKSICAHPPSPWQMSNYYGDYLADRAAANTDTLTFPQYLSLAHKGRACLGHMKKIAPISSDPAAVDSMRVESASGPARVAVPKKEMKGTLNVKVLMIDFPDQNGIQPAKYFERMLFSEKQLLSGSMREFYKEVSNSKLEVRGEVHGWIRMPQPYSFYTNGESGMEWRSYPRNSVRMAEDAVTAALQAQIPFNPDLDALGEGSITALFLIHAGRGAEVLPKREGKHHIWSHKWGLRNPVKVGDTLFARTYLTVPEDCMVGVCAHELGHLAMGWDDFYDPNYNDDGKYWDGAGNWDLMASGSYGGGGMRPVHPMGFHKFQHDWIPSETIDASRLEENPRPFTLFPIKSSHGEYSVLNIRSPAFSPTQCLLLECRSKVGFDSALPGEGLLVWRIDTSKEQVAPDFPALLLVQADGSHNLEDAYDGNSGDGGDPFPGTKGVNKLLDQPEGGKDITTSFPGVESGILITEIERHLTGEVSFKVGYRKVSK